MVAPAPLSEVVAKETEWLWYPYIPKRGITVFNGGTNVGKSTLMWNLMARLSRGKLPTGIRNAKKSSVFPKKILYQDLVDFDYSVTCMNLESYGADLSKFCYMDMKPEGRTTPTIKEFEEVIKASGIDLLVIDPVTFLFQEGTGDEEAEFAFNERIVHGLKHLAFDLDCTIILADYWLYDMDLYNVGKGAELILDAATSVLCLRRPEFKDVTTVRQVKNKKGLKGMDISVKCGDEGLYWKRASLRKNKLSATR